MRTPIRPDVIHVAITLDDGSLNIMTFVTRGEFASGTVARAPTPAAIEAEIARCAYAPRVTRWRVLDADELPTPAQRRYRAAVRDGGQGLTVDLPMAREMHRARLRRARASRLADLDVAYLRADERGDEVERMRLVAEKQRLRDLPAAVAIDTALSIDELDALWPLDLLGVADGA